MHVFVYVLRSASLNNNNKRAVDGKEAGTQRKMEREFHVMPTTTTMDISRPTIDLPMDWGCLRVCVRKHRWGKDQNHANVMESSMNVDDLNSKWTTLTITCLHEYDVWRLYLLRYFHVKNKSRSFHRIRWAEMFFNSTVYTNHVCYWAVWSDGAFGCFSLRVACRSIYQFSSAYFSVLIRLLFRRRLENR